MSRADALYQICLELEMKRRKARGLKRWSIGREQKRVWEEYEAAKVEPRLEFANLDDPKLSSMRWSAD